MAFSAVPAPLCPPALARYPCIHACVHAAARRAVVVGGTTSALLKLHSQLHKQPKAAGTAAERDAAELGQPASACMQAQGAAQACSGDGRDDGLCDVLVIDEASMMPAPHMLALASVLLRPQGALLLGGDHR